MKKVVNEYKELVCKSIGAALLISLGDFALLKLGSPIGPLLFAFGLLGVCYIGQNLFTDKCGFLFSDKIKITDLLIILVTNLLFGYLFGLSFRYADPSIINTAVAKVNTWNWGIGYFINSILCGVIMYIAVFMYKKGTPLGIIYGIPLFIFCGFQHCIANVITMGVALSFNSALLLSVIGNFVGSLLMYFISKDSIK